MFKLSVLVIDDDNMISQAIKNILLEKEVNIEIVSSALEATSRIEVEKQTYDAIICDINMPKMNGIEFGERFYEHFPIVLISGFLEEDLQDKILDICDAYVEKLEAAERLYPALMKAIERKGLRSCSRAA